MKKITIVAHGLSDGGAERVAAILSNKLAEYGNEVEFIAVYSSKKVYKLRDDVKYVFVSTQNKNKIFQLINRSKYVDKEINKFKPDIVISFIINEVILTNLKGKYPIIYSLRIDPREIMKKLKNRLLCKISYNRARNIVFQTPDARDFFKEEIRKKGIIIGNPLTPNLPYWKGNNHRKNIITACRLTPQKNLKMLIDAFKIFVNKHKDYILEIYGDGPLLEELKQYCIFLKIENFVKFPGFSKKIHEIMSKSSIFVLTSDFEGLSNSMLEALAIGVPTICTDCPPGGASLYIKDGINGILIKVGDTEELATKLTMLAEDKQQCEKFSEESIKIRNELDQNVIIEKWNKIIENYM